MAKITPRSNYKGGFSDGQARSWVGLAGRFQ